MIKKRFLVSSLKICRGFFNGLRRRSFVFFFMLQPKPSSEVKYTLVWCGPLYYIRLPPMTFSEGSRLMPVMYCGLVSPGWITLPLGCLSLSWLGFLSNDFVINKPGLLYPCCVSSRRCCGFSKPS